MQPETQLETTAAEINAQLPGKHDAEGWSYLSKLSPVLNSGLMMFVALSIVFVNARDRIIGLFFPPFRNDFTDHSGYGGDTFDVFSALAQFGYLVIIGLVVLAGLLVWLVSWVEWRFTRYRVTAEAVQLRKGMLFKQQKVAPLRKIQGVDLERKLLAKIMGLAAVSITTAGGNLKLEYLSYAAAQQVREQLLRLVHITNQPATAAQQAGVAEAGAPTVGGTGAQADPQHSNLPQQLIAPQQPLAATHTAAYGTAPQPPLSTSGTAPQMGATAAHLTQYAAALLPETAAQSVVKLSPGRILLSLLLSGTTVFIGILVLVGLPLLFLLPHDIDDLFAIGFGFIFALLPAAIALISMVFKTLNESYNFNISDSPSGVLITAGLTTTKTATVPQRRINAIEVNQPLLWRLAGWYRVKFVSSGGGTEAEMASGKGYLALPVGSRDEVLRVLELLLQTEVPQALAAAVLNPKAKLPYRAALRATPLLTINAKMEGAALLSAGGKPVLLSKGGLATHRNCLILLDRAQAVQISSGPLHTLLRLHRVEAIKRGMTTRSAIRGLRPVAARELFTEINQAQLRKTSEAADAA